MTSHRYEYVYWKPMIAEASISLTPKMIARWEEIVEFLEESAIPYIRVDNCLALGSIENATFERIYRSLLLIEWQPLVDLFNKMVRPVKPSLIPNEIVEIQPVSSTLLEMARLRYKD